MTLLAPSAVSAKKTLQKSNFPAFLKKSWAKNFKYVSAKAAMFLHTHKEKF
jgi:hypothetical protein